MPLSNTELAQELQVTIDGWQEFVTQVKAWAINEVATVEFTDPQTGNPISVPTLWKIEDDYANLTGQEWAITPEDTLVPSGNMVDEYSALHWAKKAEAFVDGVSSIQAELDLVETYKNQAQTAASNAATSETNAATSESNAATSESNASASATAASNDADDAAADASAASDSASTAQAWATTAVDVEVNPGNYSALHWATKAEDWAETPEDTEVETGKYSALHWAAKAEYWAGQAQTNTLDSLTDINTAAKADGFIIFWDQTAGEYQFMDFAHTHAISEVTGLQSALDAKADDSHTHTISDVTNLQAELDGKTDDGHTHTLSDVSDVDSASLSDLDALLYDSGTGFNFRPITEADISDLQSYALSGHSHAISDVTGLQAALDDKSDDTHGHTIADITNLQAELDGKSDDGHTHVVADIDDIVFTSLSDDHILFYDANSMEWVNRPITESDIIDLGNYANASHGHSISDVSGLQTALDGKASDSHGHAIADITGLQTELDGKADDGHSHTISDVTNLQSELDSKSDNSHHHDSDYVQNDQPGFAAPVVLQLDERSARSSGTESVSIAGDSKVYLPVSGNNVTIDLSVPPLGTLNGITDIHMTGTVLVEATAAISGLSVTTDATDSDISGDPPTASGEFKLLKYEFYKGSSVEYLKAVWV